MYPTPAQLNLAIWLLNLTQVCMDILKQAGRPATWAYYAAKWKIFVYHSLNQQIQPLSPTVKYLIGYLFHLLQAGLAYTTIRLYLAALASYMQNGQVNF